MGYTMKYNKNNFPFKESPLEAADPELIKAATKESEANIPEKQEVDTGEGEEIISETIGDVAGMILGAKTKAKQEKMDVATEMTPQEIETLQVDTSGPDLRKR